MTEVYCVSDFAENCFLSSDNYSHTLNIGGLTSMAADTTAGNIFTAKFKANGQAIWLRQIDASGVESAKSVSSLTNGNCIITGSFASDSIVFGNTTVIRHSFSSLASMFVATYDASGNEVTAVSPISEINDYFILGATDNQGHCFVGGEYRSDSIYFGSILLTPADRIFNARLSLVNDSGITDNETNLLSVYPNPCSGHFTVSLPASVIDENHNLKIYSIVGRCLMEKQFTGNKTTLDVDFSDGVYILKSNNAHSIFISRLIVQ